MDDHKRDSAPISAGEGAGWRPWETPGQVPFAPAEEQEQPGEADRSIWSAVQEQVLRENGRSDGAASAAASSVGDGAAFGGARGGAARGGAYDFSAGSSTIHDASSTFSAASAFASSTFASSASAASAFASASADPIDDIVRKVRRGRRVRLAIWCVIAAVLELFVVALCWMLSSDPNAAQVLRIAAIVLGVVLVAFTAPLFAWARYPDLTPDERGRFRAAVESFASGDFAGAFNGSAGFAGLSGFSALTGNGSKGMIYNPLRNAPGFISIVLPTLFGPTGIIIELVLASLRRQCFRRSDRFFVWWFAGWGVVLGLICWFGVRLVVAALSGGIHITS